MTVFKGFLTITKQNLHIVSMYITIFLAICIMVQQSGASKQISDFQMEQLEIAVIDRDHTELSKGLSEYLKQYHILKDIPDDQSALQDAMFYRDIYYAVIIPENFEEKCLENGEKLSVTKVPGSSNGYYIDQQINTYLNGVKVLISGGYSLPDAIFVILQQTSDETDVTLLNQEKHQGEMPDYGYMYQFIPYIMMSIICYAIGYIMISFKKPDLQKRIACSSVSIRSQNLQLVLGYIVIGAAVWIICTLMSLLFYKNEFLQDANCPYYLMNCFCIMLVSLALSFLVGTLVERDDILSAVVNVITLGMSFTCGVFVTLDIMSKEIQTAAHFLPAYWYEINNQLLAHNSSLSDSQLHNLFVGYGIQILFAAALLSIALIITKSRRQAEN